MDSTYKHNAPLEGTLVTRVATGDAQAFEELYRLYEKRLYHYVCTLVRDPSLAEEVVGEVMLAVWRGACHFAHQSRLSTWIFGIARHKALDALRRNGRHDQDVVTIDDAPDLPSQNETPIDGIQREQLGVVTRQALAKLSPDHQEVLRLVFYEELPYEEIALLLNIPENTVKTRVFYAKQQLKRHMDRLVSQESGL
jgi:RNA polymerase sigma-70 factor (ECF subfamily)